MSDQPPTSDALRAAGKAALERRRRLREMHRSEVVGPISRPTEHYHIVYTHPRSDTSVPNYEVRFETSRDAFLVLKALGERAEPNVEWYEDGQVGMETRLSGMLGLHWMIVSVGMCHRRNCIRTRPVIEIITR